MPDPTPTLRDRLIKIIVGAIIDGGPLGDHPPNIADALLASEEWLAREAVIAAYLRCEESRGVFSCAYPHDNRCPKARADSPAQWKGKWHCECGREELDAALARLAATRGTT